MLQRLADRPACAEGIVHDERQIMLLRQRHKGLKVRHCQSGIANGFQIDRLRLRIDQRFIALHLHPIGKSRLHPDAFEGVLELIVGAAVEMRGRNKVVAHRGDVVDRDELRRMPRSRRQRRRASFESRHPLLKDIRRRIHQAGIDVPELLQCKELGTVLGALELISRRLVDRHRS